MSNSLDTYFQDHWLEIEPDRMSRYESMFQWREGQAPLIAPAAVGPGHTVVDFGCGPGGLVNELARRVEASGQVIGVDINSDFLDIANQRIADAGMTDRVSTRLMVGDAIPLPDGQADRLICKNVLEYVPDPEHTIREFHRVLKPGGIAHVTDSDWGAIICEPGGERFGRIMSAAHVAFRTPQIGRKLYGYFRAAGFRDVEVRMLASPDTVGALRPVLTNMAGYARLSEQLADAEIDQFLEGLEVAIAEQSHFAVLPQFLVTGTV